MLRPIPRNQNPESHIVTTVDKEGFLTHEWQMLHNDCARSSVLRTRQYDLSHRPKRAHTIRLRPTGVNPQDHYLS